ncbi:hypothetical protein QAD02_005843 [Eretmocerus hayati]|uniref:Uncharacterized protein n=1 Tax=Eretmocerus hayati TaxID=131215 RepID=A0ACC2NUS6_9HYME|nr:hypothetical protein QAD02_005843 [Eretmocerus hayati]
MWKRFEEHAFDWIREKSDDPRRSKYFAIVEVTAKRNWGRTTWSDARVAKSPRAFLRQRREDKVGRRKGGSRRSGRGLQGLDVGRGYNKTKHDVCPGVQAATRKFAPLARAITR